jgi:hypothetical protein
MPIIRTHYIYVHKDVGSVVIFRSQKWSRTKSLGNTDLPRSHKQAFDFFRNRTVHLEIIKVFYLPTDAQENCFKKNIKIYIKTAPTCFGAITIIREHLIRAC